VWIALTYRGHRHYTTATTWLDSLPDESELGFCRLTQLGFLRLLTNPTVMGTRVVSQTAAWDVYDEWVDRGRAVYLDEPTTIENMFRSISQSEQAAPKDWADSYISAFAQVSGLQLVTFDRALQRRTSGSLLLQP
jgi:toxin-antitoxin system PIN domain toxin